MKPPYRVPSMSEIRTLPWNGLTVASLFSGCGGSSLGYRMGGYRVAWASEFIDIAAETYRANSSGTVVDTRDIRTVAVGDLLDACNLRPGELDLLDGSPPCASFSTSGSRERDWGKTKAYSGTVQRTDDLFFEFARILRGVQPRAFVAENVRGLVVGAAKGYFLEILAALKDCGYAVRCRVLDAQWLGVPQRRQRVIFIGLRQDLGQVPRHPRPLPYYYTVRDALDGLPPSAEAECDVSRYAIGRELKRMDAKQSDRYFSLIRADFNKPCPTITAQAGNPGAASVVHPVECRKFSVAELKRLCAFPDDFTLLGDYQRQVERLGRSVPPVMMRHIADSVRTQLTGV